MSRSFKKNPVWKDNNHKNFFKKYFNRVLRHKPLDETYQHNDYRLQTCQWEVHDQISRWSEEEALQWYRKLVTEVNNGVSDWSWDREFLRKYPTEEIFINRYYKRMIRK